MCVCVCIKQNVGVPLGAESTVYAYVTWRLGTVYYYQHLPLKVQCGNLTSIEVSLSPPYWLKYQMVLFLFPYSNMIYEAYREDSLFYVPI